MTRADRIARPVALVVSLLIVAVVVLALWPRSHAPAGQCAGTTGRAALGRPYVVTLRADGSTVVSTVDFDGRLWRAVDGRVARSGLAPPSATALQGAVTLVNREEAAFGSPAAYATLLPLTKADGCAPGPVVRSGSALAGSLAGR